MKFSKGIVALVTGFAFAGLAQAQDATTSAEKKAPALTLLPTAYGSLEMRHKSIRSMENDVVVNDRITLQARPTVGATFFDGKLDVSFTGIFQRDNDTTIVKRSDIYQENYLTIVEGSAGFLKLYTYTDGIATEAGDFKTSDVMAYYSSDEKFKATTGIGEIGILVEEYLGPQFTSGKGKQTSKVRNLEVGQGATYGLKGDANDEMTKRDPDLNSIAVALPYIKPAILPALKLSAGFEQYTTWAANYKAKGEDIEQDGYSRSGFTVNRVTASYKISDKVTVANMLRQTVNGLWAAGTKESKDEARYENRLMLTATLF